MLDLTGKVFGRLTVTSVVGKVKGGYVWYCVCACGGNHEILAALLRAGRVTSCGCKRHEQGIAGANARWGRNDPIPEPLFNAPEEEVARWVGIEAALNDLDLALGATQEFWEME